MLCGNEPARVGGVFHLSCIKFSTQSGGTLGLNEPTSKEMATTSSSNSRGTVNREPPAAAGRKGGNYTSLNLQSYKGPRSDSKGYGMWVE